MKPIILSMLATVLLGLAPSENLYAQLNSDYSAVPPASTQQDPPVVMLSLSRDHQYFFKAYNDYTDLDPDDLTDVDSFGNPIIETTYKHSFDYFGYFDSFKCYEYSTGADEFTPISETANKYCSGSEWSGNFLNWASMTRMDVVRKIFYGGSRSTDTDSKTVLERAHLPLDAHSFAKYYNGGDLSLLTPYNSVTTDTANSGNNDGVDDIDEGITFCNTTDNGTVGASQNATSPPLIRVVIGNYQLWNSNERWQCTYLDDRATEDGNFNIPPSAPDTDKEFTLDDGTIITVDSGIDAHPLDPVSGDDYIVRVEVCKAGLIGAEPCKQYPNGEPKPTGLLQTYGDDGLINFGLMTGSYANNIEGGVLRKNTGGLDDEVDVNGNGTFIYTDTSESIIRSLDSLRIWGYRYSNGTYRGGSGGTNDDFDDCTFQLNEINNGDCKSWGNPISEIYKETIRYMAGLSPQTNFVTDDTPFITGLRTETWSDPLTDENQCSDLNTILINASVSSYDDNDVAIPGVPGGINGANTAANNSTTDEWTDSVGLLEGIAGSAREFFIGRNGANNNEVCDAKTIPALSDVLGLCPEAPTVNGSYAMAGIAYYAHNNDIRDKLDGNQTVNTFAISLATNVPIIQIPRTDGGNPAQILPAYRNLNDPAEPGGGALVDFRIVQPHTSIGGDQFQGKFYVSWEDSEQGGDYDQDMWGLIDYTLDESLNQLTITTTAIAESTNTEQLFGFITNGTTQDGFHAYSGISGANYTDPTGVPGCTNCRPLRGSGGATGQAGPQSHTFDLTSTVVETLESPLYFAAKYGGFEERLALIPDTTNPTGPDVLESVTLTDQPDELDEWDSVNNVTGADGADGLPDNFFFVINPENLFNSLETALNKILSLDTAANSAVAAFANSNGFENIIVQGTYQEQTRGENDTEISWTGEIFSYFIDQFGLFREDNPGLGTPGTLDGYGTDRAFKFDVDGDTPMLQYLTVSTESNGNATLDPDTNLPITANAAGGLVSVDSLQPLWSGGESLRNINNQDTVLQRNYNTAVPNNPNTRAASRYIFTHIDTNLNGSVEIGEQVPFLTSEIDNTNFGFFGAGSEADAQAVVNYTRGFDDPANTGFRSRTLEIAGESDPVIYRLGDLVNSTPLVVAGPAETYDTQFGDDDYSAFRELYKDRRQVAYVGTNDGLLHAFNVGFRDTNDSTVTYEVDNGVDTPHPLGAEIWAYAPFNLLPHLQWLTSGFYSHVFYVDGNPKSYDVKIFQPSAEHPGGWGTILVVGMRLGGGDFQTTVPNLPAGTGNFVAKSAYIVIDITDPEEEPEILAEITDDDLNLTTSEPDLFYDCGTLCTDGNDDNNFDGKWQLIFGSGPNNIKTFSTTESAKIFAYDLQTKALETHDVINNASSAPVADSFVGSIAVKDWDNGTLGFRNDDVAYFGTVGTRPQITVPATTEPIETGGVYRYIPNSPTVADDTVNRFIDTDRPVAQAPLLLSREGLGSEVFGSWVFFGTGIYLERSDEEINEQERYYGVLEPIDSDALNARSVSIADDSLEDSNLLTYGSITDADLVNVSNFQLLAADNTAIPPIEAGDFQTPLPLTLVFSPAPPAPASPIVTNFDELAEYIVTNTQGWYRELPTGVVADDPSARVTDRAVALRDQVFFSAFTPASLDRDDICVGGEGLSELFVINQTTGTASPFATLGVDGSGVINTSLIIGSGTASSPVLFTSEALGGNFGLPITQRNNGSLTSPDDEGSNQIDDLPLLRSGWREILQ